MIGPDHLIATYIVASRRNGTLYTGVTSDLPARIRQHKEGFYSGFAKKHGCRTLVWFKTGEDMASAIRLEKLIKHYGRVQKKRLIEADNPMWRDLSEGWYPDLER